MMPKLKDFVCELCEPGKRTLFSRHSNLLRHRRIFHPGCPNISLRGEPSQWFSCSVCANKYRTERTLRNHLLRQHSDVHRKKKSAGCRDVCPFGCDLKTSFKTEIIKHFEETHNIKVEEEVHSFETYEQFVTWKVKIERATKIKFVTRRSKFRGKTNTYYHFLCYRSGFFLSEGKGIRQPRLKGTCKINGMCPASMKVLENNDSGVCDVFYCRTHVGHEYYENQHEANQIADGRTEEIDFREQSSALSRNQKNQLKKTDSNPVLLDSENGQFRNTTEKSRPKEIVNVFIEDDIQNYTVDSSQPPMEHNVNLVEIPKEIAPNECSAFSQNSQVGINQTVIYADSKQSQTDCTPMKGTCMKKTKDDKFEEGQWLNKLPTINSKETYGPQRNQASQTQKTRTKSILADSNDNLLLIVEITKSDAAKNQVVVFKSYKENQSPRSANSKFVQVDTEENLVIGKTEKVIGPKRQFSASVKNGGNETTGKKSSEGVDCKSLEMMKRQSLEEFENILSCVSSMEDVNIINELLNKMKSTVPFTPEIRLVRVMTLDST